MVSGRCASAAGILGYIVICILRGAGTSAQRVDKCAQIVGVGRVALLGQSVGDLGLIGLFSQRLTYGLCVCGCAFGGQG